MDSSTEDKLFAAMKGAPIFGRGNYMGAGTYEIEIDKGFFKRTFKGVDTFVLEFKITASTNPEHPVGAARTWQPKLALPNTDGDLKALMFSVLGREPRDVPADDAEAHNLAALLACSALGYPKAIAALAALGVPDVAAVLNGKRVSLKCEQIKIKSTGGDFTRHTWGPAAPAKGGAT